MARQTIDFENVSAGPLSIDLIAIPNNSVAAAATVRLTDFASVAEIYDDQQVHAHVDAGDALLTVNGVALNQTESQAALQPASSQTIVDEGPATAPVDSVFGRTGAVTAQNGDYTATQVGADPAGTAATEAASAVSTHEAAPDPHSVYQLKAEKGVANGYPSLDATGKIPISQIPDLNGLEFKGLWDAATNTPTLTSGVGGEGDFYIVNVAGTTNLDGEALWMVKDWAIFINGSWRKIDNTDSVVSVNGQTGVVTLTMGDIAGIISDAQHGNRGGGPLHPDATTGVAGFMSATDKSKLDGIETGAKDDQNADEVPVTDSLPEITGDVQQSLENLQAAIGTVSNGEIPTAAARMTTSMNLTSTWTDVPFNQTSIETDTSVVEHSNTNNDRILLKEPGAYMIIWTTQCSVGGEDNVNIRVRLNDATTLPDFPDSFFIDSGSATDMDWNLTRVGFVTTTLPSDFISLQAREDAGTNSIENTVFVAIRLRAPKGDPGPAGAGEVQVEQDGVPVSGSPFDTINFLGATVAQDGNTADVTIPTVNVWRQARGDTETGTNFTSTPVTVSYGSFSDSNVPATFTHSSGQFTAQFTGFVEVSYTVTCDVVSGTSRSRFEVWAELNGVEIAGTRTRGYCRQVNFGDTATLPPLEIKMNAGDVFRVRANRTTGGATIGFRPDCMVSLKRTA